MKIKKPEINTSLIKCPPSSILIVPNKRPKKRESQRYSVFFVIKKRAIIENPTDASPETKEQFLIQESEI